MNPNIHGRALACTLIALSVIHLPAHDAFAGGFAVRENSGSMLGNAFAGVPTNTEDISSISNNPGLLGAFDGINAAAGISFIVPNAEFKNGQASSAPAVGPVPINNDASIFKGNDDIGRNAFIPATYVSLSVTDELKFGLSITAPFGLLTDNPDGWVGRYHGLKSQLETIDLNPIVAYRVTDYLSIGGGFRAVYADAELSQAVDVGSLAAVLGSGTATPTQNDGRAKLQGDDWGFGGNAGIMFEPGKLYAPLEGLRLGVGYRSRVEIKVDGKVKFDMSGTSGEGAIVQGAGFLVNTDATAEVDLPESVTFGAQYDLNDQWAFMGQVEWTNWSEFDELVVEIDQGAQGDNITEEDWNDGWFFAVGSTYRPDWGVEGLALRLGLAYELSPVPDSTRTPRIPDNDRFWVATGINYQPFPWASVDFGYTHIFVKDADIDLEAESATDFRGSLSGEYQAHIDIFALQANLTF